MARRKDTSSQKGKSRGATAWDRREVKNFDAKELEAFFPKLRFGVNAKKTSEPNPRYNCMAYANGTERKWWQAGLFGGMYHWPPDVEEADSVRAWTEVFTKQGYIETDNAQLEAGCAKVAIYMDLKNNEASHVAWSDGNTWKSKLGKGHDIEHSSLDVLEGDKGDEFGLVAVVLKK